MDLRKKLENGYFCTFLHAIALRKCQIWPKSKRSPISFKFCMWVHLYIKLIHTKLELMIRKTDRPMADKLKGEKNALDVFWPRVVSFTIHDL